MVEPNIIIQKLFLETNENDYKQRDTETSGLQDTHLPTVEPTFEEVFKIMRATTTFVSKR